MEINEATKLIACGLISELMKKRRSQGVKKAKPIEKELSADMGAHDAADINFGDLEAYYKNVICIIENTPEIRQSIVDTLVNLQQQGKDLNNLYPSMKLAEEKTLRQILFLTDVA